MAKNCLNINRELIWRYLKIAKDLQKAFSGVWYLWWCMFCVIWPVPSEVRVWQTQILASLPAFLCLMASIQVVSKLPTSLRRRGYEIAHNANIKSGHLFRHKRLAENNRDTVWRAWEGRSSGPSWCQGGWKHAYEKTWCSSDHLAGSYARKCFIYILFHCIVLSLLYFLSFYLILFFLSFLSCSYSPPNHNLPSEKIETVFYKTNKMLNRLTIFGLEALFSY